MGRLIRGRYIWNRETQEMEKVPDEWTPRRLPPVHSVITDEIAPTECMADGKIYTSRHKMRAAVKAAGYEETGGVSEVASKRDMSAEKEAKGFQMKDTIEQAYHKCKNGNNDVLTSDEREKCRAMDNESRRKSK